MSQGSPEAHRFEYPIKDIRIGIVTARFNPEICAALLGGAKRGLATYGIQEGQVFLDHVPGSFEIPLAALRLARSGSVDAVICLGVVIRGDTPHFEYVCRAVTDGVLAVNLQTEVPAIFGVLTCDSEEQAWQRSGPGDDNKGVDAAHAAMEMISALRKISER